MSGSTFVGRQAALSRSLDKSGKALHLLLPQLASDADGSLPLAMDSLREAMSHNFSRIVDLFRDIDHDGSGTVSKQEFRQVLPLLGISAATPDQVDKFFDLIDSDGSGVVEYRELHEKLRAGKDISWTITRQRHVSRAGPAYYCASYSGMQSRPVSWHEVRGRPPPGDRLLRSPRPRTRPPPPTKWKVGRPAPEETPLLERTTPHWHTAPASPRGMRIALRPVTAPGEVLSSSDAFQRSLLRSSERRRQPQQQPGENAWEPAAAEAGRRRGRRGQHRGGQRRRRRRRRVAPYAVAQAARAA